MKQKVVFQQQSVTGQVQSVRITQNAEALLKQMDRVDDIRDNLKTMYASIERDIQRVIRQVEEDKGTPNVVTCFINNCTSDHGQQFELRVVVSQTILRNLNLLEVVFTCPDEAGKMFDKFVG